MPCDGQIRKNSYKEIYDLKHRGPRRKQNSAFVSTSSNKNKMLWAIINQEWKGQNVYNCTERLKIQNKIITDPYNIVDHFNKYLATLAALLPETAAKKLKLIKTGQQVNSITDSLEPKPACEK